MPSVRILTNTGLTDDHLGFQRLPAGTTMQVSEEVARRWTRNRIAEPWDGPVGGVVGDQEAHASPADLDAEIARLTALRDAVATGKAAAKPGDARTAGVGTPTRTAEPFTIEAPAGLPADAPTANPYADPGAPGPFDHAKLTEKQLSALHAAGFTRLEHLERATDDEVLEALGGGKGSEAALARLRAGPA